MINIAINGFGRIGRLVLKRAITDKKINIVAINDLSDPATLAHLMKYDSVHGKFPGTVSAKKNSITINGKSIHVFAEKEPEKLPWKKLKIDVAVESTGIFRTNELLSNHLKAGALKVVLSAPGKGGEKLKTIVMGVNEKTYNGEKIVSNASCTTNCFAPMAKLLNDKYGIIDGVMTTIHSYTNDQSILDSPHKDLRRARAAAINIVPTSTGAAESIGEVIPELKGRIIGSAIRVPTVDSSLTYFVASLSDQKSTCMDYDINELFKKASKSSMKGIVEFSSEPLVSSDIIGNPHSCVFDSLLTRCVDEKVIVVGWYDNEWGYSCRMVDVIKHIMKK